MRYGLPKPGGKGRLEMEKGTPGGTGAGHGEEGPGVRNWSWAWWRRPRGQELELGTVEKAPGSGAGAGGGSAPTGDLLDRVRRETRQQKSLSPFPLYVWWLW